MLTFVDFNINFGLSLTIGSGNTFERDSSLVKIGSSDILVERNDTILLIESEIWIWFQISDPQSRSEEQTEIRLGSGQTVNFDTYPSAHGIHLWVHNADKGLLSEIIIRRFNSCFFSFLKCKHFAKMIYNGFIKLL